MKKILILVFLFAGLIIAPIVIFASSGQFKQKAQEWYTRNCKPSASREQSMMCYTYDKVHELESVVNGIIKRLDANDTTNASQSDKLEALTSRIDLLERELSPKTYFVEDFNGSTIDTNIWEVHQNNDRVNVLNGELTVTGADNSSFPFIQLKINPIPQDLPEEEYTIELKINYKKRGAAGAGFIVTKEVQPPYQPVNNSATSVGIWNDGIRYHVDTIFPLSIPDYHVYKYVYRVNKWFIYVDNELIYNAVDAEKPIRFWIGNPAQGTWNDWTEFSIDYIKVTIP